MVIIMSSKEVELDSASLKKLQGEILDLLVEFDRVCRKHGIRYFLSCGTLLGAVRHHGFIPWDNDADVEMFREDYEKFRRVCQQELNSKLFYFQDSTNDDEYSWPYGKLRKKGTKYIRPGQRTAYRVNGICIDVFVMDTMAPSYFMQYMMYQLTCGCRKILWSPVGMVSLNNPLMRMWFRLLNLIPRDAALWFYHFVTGWYRGKNTGWLGFFNTGRSSARSYAYKSDWYAGDVDCEFEGHIFNIPSGYDEILRVKYQDYMQLPPVEKRVGTSGAEYIKFSDGTELRI